MASIHIHRPESLPSYLERQATAEGYASTREYVQALLREEQPSDLQQKLEATLLEGLDSGGPIKAGPNYWRKKEASLRERHSGIGL
jgi:hypothetical protein